MADIACVKLELELDSVHVHVNVLIDHSHLSRADNQWNGVYGHAVIGVCAVVMIAV